MHKPKHKIAQLVQSWNRKKMPKNIAGFGVLQSTRNFQKNKITTFAPENGWGPKKEHSLPSTNFQGGAVSCRKGTLPMFNGKYIFKWLVLHCHASFQAGYITSYFSHFVVAPRCFTNTGILSSIHGTMAEGCSTWPPVQKRQFWKWTYSPSMLCIPRDPGSPSLVGGFRPPSRKKILYRQIGSFSQGLGWKLKMFETTTQLWEWSWNVNTVPYAEEVIGHPNHHLRIWLDS